MSNHRKTTQRDLRLFEEACRYWWKRLGLIEVGLIIRHGRLRAWAEVTINWESRCAIATLGQEVPKEWTDRDIRESGLHEMLHVLMARICYPASRRTSSQEDLEQFEESIVRTLETVIGELAYGKPDHATKP